MQFLETAAPMIDRPIYQQLLETGRLFREGDRGVRAAVDKAWDTIVGTDSNPAGPADMGTDGGSWAAAGRQNDAADLLEYLLRRLMVAEVPMDLYK